MTEEKKTEAEEAGIEKAKTKIKSKAEEKAAEKAAKQELKQVEKEEKKTNDPMSDKSLSLAERRHKAAQIAAAAINKKYGKGTIGSGKSNYRPVRRLSSGIFILDFALGGGWARGRVNIPWGARSSNKTSSMLRTCGIAQNTDSVTNKFLWELTSAEQKEAIPMSVAWIDVEGAFDWDWAAKLGVNTDLIQYSQPSTGEETAEIVETLLKSKTVDVIVIDSLAAMIPQAELEAAMDENQMGGAGKINSKMFRKIQSSINEFSKDAELKDMPPTVFVINQERHKIGMSFGDPRYKPGGASQEFFSSIEVLFSGNKVEYYDEAKMLPKTAEFGFKIEKNKVSPPKIQGKYKMQLVDDPYEGGPVAGSIIEVKEVMEFAEKMGIYGKDGNKFLMYGEAYKTKGEIMDKFILDPQRFLTLKKDVIAKLIPKQ